MARDYNTISSDRPDNSADSASDVLDGNSFLNGRAVARAFPPVVDSLTMVPPSSEAGQAAAGDDGDSVFLPKVDSLTSPPPSSEAGQAAASDDTS